MDRSRPLVGLLCNPTTSRLVAHVPALIEYIAVMPDRLWYDFGPRAGGRRFHRVFRAMDDVRTCCAGRVAAGHGIGMSLPSAIPLDEPLLDAMAGMAAAFGFSWFSEHLSVFVTPKGGVPNAQAGLGLPIAYDEEVFGIVRDKTRRLRARLGCPILLETGAFFTPVPDCDMTEPQFLNRLYREEGVGTLLDLHNIYVTGRNDGVAPEHYLRALDPDAVMEIHLGGGDEMHGFYLDSHSSLTPGAVWALAFEHVPRFRNLKAITFEYQEQYFAAFGLDGLTAELERMHDLASAWGAHAG
jgi:uncharacterized protein (UPF0276 family)